MKRNHLLSLLPLLSDPSSPSTVVAYIQNPVVIAPGFMYDSLDYRLPFGRESHRSVGLVAALEKRGFEKDLIFTTPMIRGDWLRTLRGLVDPATYRGVDSPTGEATDPALAYGWYLDRFRAAIDKAHDRSGGKKVVVVGHSAGGWLARAGLGDGLWRSTKEAEGSDGRRRPSSSSSGGGWGKCKHAAEKVACLVTLGAIHKPPVRAFPFFTRGALAHTDARYPGAHLREEGVGYVSVGSDAVVAHGSAPSSRSAYAAYEMVCGRGDVEGDGIVPYEWTRLEGARQIRLDDAVHSFSATEPTDDWYGADAVVDRWLPA
ncbi:hypothetical protein ACHAWF_001069, partial [Thalassiosira exigua]